MTEKNAEFQIRETGRRGVYSHDGQDVVPPENWIFVPSGDPGLTRRLKAAGAYYVLVYRHKNRWESKGIFTDGTTVAQVKAQLATERANPAYARKQENAKRRRDEKQSEYTVEFRAAVKQFLAFAPRYAAQEALLSDAVTLHAVPVGSGTVARTERIPLPRRAEAAVIAWMRHQTTAYDHMAIARVRGARREVRRALAERSREILDSYRAGNDVDSAHCPLAAALKHLAEAAPEKTEKQES